MSAVVLLCDVGNVFDGLSDALTGPAEILVEGDRIARVERHHRLRLITFPMRAPRGA